MTGMIIEVEDESPNVVVEGADPSDPLTPIIEVLVPPSTVTQVEITDPVEAPVIEVEVPGAQGPAGNDNLILLEAGEGVGDIPPETLDGTIVFRKA